MQPQISSTTLNTWSETKDDMRIRIKQREFKIFKNWRRHSRAGLKKAHSFIFYTSYPSAVHIFRGQSREEITATQGYIRLSPGCVLQTQTMKYQATASPSQRTDTRNSYNHQIIHQAKTTKLYVRHDRIEGQFSFEGFVIFNFIWRPSRGETEYGFQSPYCLR